MQLICDFTNIHGGVSKTPYKSLNLAYHVHDNPLDVDINRQILAKKYGIKDIISMNQVHGVSIEAVNKKSKIPTCDGLITNQRNLALIVLVADCIPLLLYDKQNQAIGAIHAGRAGAFGNIAQKACEAMNEHFNTKNLKAFLGASIMQCCYEIDGEVLKYAKDNFPNYVKNNYLDIRGIVKYQLQNLGIEVISKEKCTSCDKNYFSYRRDGLVGRFAGIIALKDKNA